MESSGVRTVCVLGAGVSGLCILRQLSFDAVSCARYRLTAYEQAASVGGIWKYPDGCEEFTKDVPPTSSYFCRIYRDLWINTPSEFTQFSDFPIPPPVKKFRNRMDIIRYLEDYAEIRDLNQFIQFRHKVLRVRRIPGKCPTLPHWEVTVENLADGSISETVFDVVVVCSGRNDTPFHGDEPGLVNFAGPVIHSSEYRVPEPCRGKAVLVIGAGHSGKDVACALIPHAEKVVLCNTTTEKIFHGEYQNLLETSEIVGYGENSAILRDGTVIEIDAIILCTGFQLRMDFLTESCGVDVSRGRVYPLYRHSINCKYHSMAFMGLLFGGLFFIGAETQAKYYKAFLDGKMVIPSVHEMIKDTDEDYARKLESGAPAHHAHSVVNRFWDLTDRMGEEAGFSTDYGDRAVIREHRRQMADMPCVAERIKKWSNMNRPDSAGAG